MTRPRKKGLDYFPHDTDAYKNDKIDHMREVFGNDGYAFYFILCELIYRQENAELDVSNPIKKTVAVKRIGVSAEQFEQMMGLAIEVRLFDPERYECGFITSTGILTQFKTVHTKRDKWREHKESIEKFSIEKTKVFHMENEVFQRENEVFQRENRGFPHGKGGFSTSFPFVHDARDVREKDLKDLDPKDLSDLQDKEITDKEIKDIKSVPDCENVTLTTTEYGKLVVRCGGEKQALRMIEKLSAYKGSKGKRYKSDYQAIRQWVLRDEGGDNGETTRRQNNARSVRASYVGDDIDALSL